MAEGQDRAAKFISDVFRSGSVEELRRRLRPRPDEPSVPLPRRHEPTPKLVDRRWALLDVDEDARAALADDRSLAEMKLYARNVENFVGTVKTPVGIAGPLRVNGLFALGDYYVPLATTEAALVASYSRGAKLITEAGGCTAMVLNEGVTRAPGFVFANLRDAGAFVAWAVSQREAFTAVANATTGHGALDDMSITVEGNHVYLGFTFLTGDAAGQNMVTFATAAICEYIREHTPVQPRRAFVEANLSGDKKASAQSFMTVRGRKVSAEILVPADLVASRLHTTVDAMVEYWRISAIGGALSGTIGFQGHYANALAALYLACGQDVASVSESAVGLTRFERVEDGALYAAVTMPNIIVGTVGGGTGLPSQQACLRILGLAGTGKARALAEVCCAIALAGELSIIGALAAGQFAQAHRKLGRSTGPGKAPSE